MSIQKSVCSTLIKNYQLRELFNVLGWNQTTNKEQVTAFGQEYNLEAIAEKNAFFVFLCKTSGRVPDYAIRKKIDTDITRLYHQHLIIYADNNRRQQVWQLVVMEPDKSAVVRETSYFSTQEPDLLFQKLRHLFFSIDDEDNISTVDVTNLTNGEFTTNVEKITRKFYEGFRKERTAFLASINGIPDSEDKNRYASLMLNRLMFVYFIQNKGFLNDDRFYLKTKLAETRSRREKDTSLSFYRSFLLVLFHRGLGSPDNRRFEKELGKVPYLNGGLFDVHQLENSYSDVQIDDKAFERLFSFFDQYEWRMDTRQQISGNELNPDVIGYIFEKYINNRAAMGAYYTKEDITGYIGKNCIIPFLFDELKRHYPTALKPDGEVWSLLKNCADDYIYDAVKHGITHPLSPSPCQGPFSDKGRRGEGLPLPPEIAAGLDDVSKRTEWNKPAPAEYALPTEIWREVVERRRRYSEIKMKIEAGEIHTFTDLVTYNLNVTRFAIDIIQNSNNHELIRHFYKALVSITVLDPTCGSGAFLFASLNILEPLYEACLGRMHAFVAEAIAGKYKAFEDILKRVEAPEHPNLQYFVFKSIILNNLFGVDIMEEAIEIAKLRLFLKLVATVDVDYKKPNMGLEPLPDIDFNIRSGNTLVGFVSIDEVKKAVEGQLGFFDKDIEHIETATEYVRRAYDSFREVQLVGDVSVKEFKKILTEKMAKLNERLDVYLGKLYGKDPQKPTQYQTWHVSHKPFHWLAEFYEIIHDRGGFDVIIGNPPFVEYSQSKRDYTIIGYETMSCGSLYACVWERCLNISNNMSNIGMIVPVAAVCTDGYEPLQKNFRTVGTTIVSSFNDRPGKLFEGLDHVRLSIVLLMKGKTKGNTHATAYNKWNIVNRDTLFNRLLYINTSQINISGSMAKICTDIEKSIIEKINKDRGLISNYVTSGRHMISYTRKLSHFVQILNFVPEMTDENGVFREPSELKFLSFSDRTTRDIFLSILNSNLFYWMLTVYSDCRNLNKREITSVRFDVKKADIKIIEELANLSTRLMDDIRAHSKMHTMSYKNIGTLNIQCTYPYLSKPIIDKIDTVLATHYGFTDEELDFIINYDIKYRMDKGSNGDEDAE